MLCPGIIGGLGPATTAEFYLELIRRCRRRYPERYPRILIHSVPVPFDLERGIVLHGQEMSPLYPLLAETARSLERAGADFIALPCNTVHHYHAQLQGELRVPLLNILEITAVRCAALGARRVAVLGTRRTLETGLYHPALEQQGLTPLPLEPSEVERCAALIYRLLADEGQPGDRDLLLQLMTRLAERGADTVILCCTDLQLLIKPEDRDLPLPAVDSVDALLEETARRVGADFGGKPTSGREGN